MEKGLRENCVKRVERCSITQNPVHADTSPDNETDKLALQNVEDYRVVFIHGIGCCCC